MDDNSEADKIDDVMLPGFRFHPTDEELVGFYLKRKIQQRPLQIELIKQVDIYKYDPWDLPKLASTGEKEWYFYCPRDRKYRNSARPNRVTGAGFWKATGTDRPIYSSEGTHCIGLKKSLVFYRGRAARGMKTDWMMHEFRLPSVSDPTSPKKILDKRIPANDAWAICRIFKKTNSMAQRALSHSWVSPIAETTAFDMFNQGTYSSTQFSPETISCSTDIPPYKPVNPSAPKSSPFSIPNGDIHTGFMYSPSELSGHTSKSTTDVASMLLNISPTLTCNGIDFGGLDSEQNLNGFFINPSHDVQGNDIALRNVRSIGFPFSLPSDVTDEWKPVLSWDSPPCPSEMSTTYSK